MYDPHFLAKVLKPVSLVPRVLRYRKTCDIRLAGLSPFARKFHRTYDEYFYIYFIPT